MLTTLRESPRSSVALGDPPCLGGWPLIKINSLHNNIVIVIAEIVSPCLPQFSSILDLKVNSYLFKLNNTKSN